MSSPSPSSTPDLISKIAFPGVNLKLWLLGDLLAAVAYGLVLSLTIACLGDFRPLLKQPTTTPDNQGFSSTTSTASGPRLWSKREGPGRVRLYLFFYTIFMLSLSTLSFVVGAVATFGLIFPGGAGVAQIYHFGDACALVFANWGADALMIWRCVVVCRGIHSTRQKALYVLLSVLALASFASGVLYIASAQNTLNTPMLVFGSITACTNIIIASIIASRLTSHTQYIKSMLGANVQSNFNLYTYNRLVHVCVESAALIVVFNIVHVGLAATHVPNRMLPVPHQLLVHIYVISAMLILHRLSKERSAERNEARERNSIVNSLHFTRSFQTADEETAVRIVEPPPLESVRR